MTRIADLPSALERWDEIEARIGGRPVAVFLDYDGTLTPIVERPEDARLTEAARGTLRRLAARHPLALLSGRDLDDVRDLVGIDGIVYAGSHGFDIAGPEGFEERRAADALPHLDRAEEKLRPLIEAVPGALLERKRFAIAAHHRLVEPERVPDVEEAVRRVAEGIPELRVTHGKQVVELRPDVDWDKGAALRRLIEALGLGDAVPLFVGDDVTDEDALRAVAGDGIGVVVRGEDDDRETSASYALAGTAEVLAFLDRLAG